MSRPNLSSANVCRLKKLQKTEVHPAFLKNSNKAPGNKGAPRGINYTQRHLTKIVSSPLLNKSARFRAKTADTSRQLFNISFALFAQAEGGHARLARKSSAGNSSRTCKFAGSTWATLRRSAGIITSSAPLPDRCTHSADFPFRSLSAAVREVRSFYEPLDEAKIGVGVQWEPRGGP